MPTFLKKDFGGRRFGRSRFLFFGTTRCKKTGEIVVGNVGFYLLTNARVQPVVPYASSSRFFHLLSFSPWILQIQYNAVFVEENPNHCIPSNLASDK